MSIMNLKISAKYEDGIISLKNYIDKDKRDPTVYEAELFFKRNLAAIEIYLGNDDVIEVHNNELKRLMETLLERPFHNKLHDYYVSYMKIFPNYNFINLVKAVGKKYGVNQSNLRGSDDIKLCEPDLNEPILEFNEESGIQVRKSYPMYNRRKIREIKKNESRLVINEMSSRSYSSLINTSTKRKAINDRMPNNLLINQ